MTNLNMMDNLNVQGVVSICRLLSLKELLVGQTGLVDWEVITLANQLKRLKLLAISRELRSRMCIFLLRKVLAPGTKLE